MHLVNMHIYTHELFTSMTRSRWVSVEHHLSHSDSFNVKCICNWTLYVDFSAFITEPLHKDFLLVRINCSCFVLLMSEEKPLKNTCRKIICIVCIHKLLNTRYHICNSRIYFNYFAYHLIHLSRIRCFHFLRICLNILKLYYWNNVYSWDCSDIMP